MTRHTCCASPDERHAAYCITTGPTGGRSSTGGITGWTDERVLREMHVQADVCVAVMSMPEDERSRPGAKGAASPAQAATLNAVIALHLEREAQRRGLIPA